MRPAIGDPAPYVENWTTSFMEGGPVDPYSLSAEAKRRLLAGFDVASSRGVGDEFLLVEGLSQDVLTEWRRLDAAGILDTAVPADRARGHVADITPDDITTLWKLFRAVMTQRRIPSGRSVRVHAAARKVVMFDNGQWRSDYLARARLALTCVADSLADNADEVFGRGQVFYASSHCAATVRELWGIDRFPGAVRRVLSAAERRSHETARRRAERWSSDAAAHPTSRQALDRWLREVAPTLPSGPPIASEDPPVWQTRPELWPHGAEGEHVVRLTQDGLDGVNVHGGEDRFRQVLRRRALALHDNYLAGGEVGGEYFLYLRHAIARPWFQTETLVDLRGNAELGETERVPRSTRAVSAAIASMSMHLAVIDWSQYAMEEIVQTRWAMAIAFGGGSALDVNGRRVAAKGAGRSVVEAKEPALPLFASDSRPEVRELFNSAQYLRLTVQPEFFNEYLSKRNALNWDGLNARDQRAVLLADYSVNLDATNRGLRDRLPDDAKARMRELLGQSSSAGPHYSVADARNQGLLFQDRDFEQSVRAGVNGLSQLARIESHRADSRRSHAEMTEQLELFLAGTSVKWLEHLMTLSPIESKAVANAQWVQHVTGTLLWSARVVDSVKKLQDRAHLDHVRYSTGFLADDRWPFRAFETRYRSICAATTVLGAFTLGGDELALIRRGDLLRPAMADAATLETIDPAQLPRLTQSILWHSFLTGGELPFLGSSLHPLLLREDHLTRIEYEDDDDTATVQITLDRLILASQWLAERNWSTGSLTRIPRKSRFWSFLNDRSGGLYGEWREWHRDYHHGSELFTS